MSRRSKRDILLNMLPTITRFNEEGVKSDVYQEGLGFAVSYVYPVLNSVVYSRNKSHGSIDTDH